MKSTPSPAIGIYPFWFWNGDQQEEELSRQVRLFAAAGCKGMVLHSRQGNRTPYLSDRWFALVRHVCLEAKAAGLKVWLYDEDGYPSGNAGGQVQKLRPELAQTSLVFAYGPADPAHPAYAAYDAGTYERVDESAVAPGTTLLRFCVRRWDFHVDTMNPESSRLFIELTHERYAAAVGDLFGDVIEAVYTDDESTMTCTSNGLPYSPVLEAEYARRHGRPLTDDLPRLVEELPGFEDVRLRFHRLAGELFRENFIRPQQDWCTAHGLTFVGHLCGDEGTLATSLKNFGLAQPYMLLEDVPSIDSFLCDLRDHSYLRRTHNDDRTGSWSSEDPLEAATRNFPVMLPYVQAGSIARLFKEGRFSDETLTYIGWEAPPSFQDTQMLYEVAQGVTLMTPHAYYYTIGEGCRFECPPSYFYQQPYHPMLGDLQRKWTHCAELLSAGLHTASTLVVSPAAMLSAYRGRDLGTSWLLEAYFTGRHERPDDPLAALERALTTCFLSLHRAHVGFELLDETILLDRATLADDGTLRAGTGSFRTVVLPSELPLLPETVALLARFEAAGGRVLRGPAPSGLAPAFDPGPCTEEVLVHDRTLPDGSHRTMLLNLSGRDLEIRHDSERPFRLYDPASRTVSFTGTSLPRGTMLRTGSACFFLEEDFDAPAVALSESVFAPPFEWYPTEFLGCRALRPNVLPLVPESALALEIPFGARIDAFYAEHLAPGALRSAGESVPGEALPHHDCDPSYRGFRPATPMEGPSVRRLTMPSACRPLYACGSFAVRRSPYAGPRLAPPPEALRLGDLPSQGYPYYWGEFDYSFRFEGRARLLSVRMEGGMAEVFVNGIRCGVVSADPFLLPIAAATRDGENRLEIRFANTAQNFVSDKPPTPFGIHAVCVG